MLMQSKTAPTTALPATATAATSANATATAAPSTEVVGETEQALLNSIAISDRDFETLASDRAKTVRAYVLQTGKVEPERVFLTESQPGGVKTNGSKAFLQLR